jgi:hypothetical protein
MSEPSSRERIPSSDRMLMQAESEYEALAALDHGETDEEFDRIAERQTRIEALMIDCATQSLSGLRAKAQMLKFMLRPNIEGKTSDPEDRVAWSLIEDIERSYKFERREESFLPDRFKGLSLPELGALLDAYFSASDALQAAYNMPKLSDGDHEAPLDILEAEIERLGDVCGEIAQEAEHRDPQSREDGFAKAKLLVTCGIRCGEGWGTIAKIATSALRNES